jgi:hypothetical protein
MVARAIGMATAGPTIGDLDGSIVDVRAAQAFHVASYDCDRSTGPAMTPRRQRGVRQSACRAGGHEWGPSPFVAGAGAARGTFTGLRNRPPSRDVVTQVLQACCPVT